jgi:hypothetical protein
MQKPPLDPDVADTAPESDVLTGYDEQHLVTYFRLLDADSDDAAQKMPSPGDKSPSSALSGTVWFLERPNFIEGFSAIPPTEKAEDRKCWRRERNWYRTFSTYSIVPERVRPDAVRLGSGRHR